MHNGTHFRFISRETTNKVRLGYRVLTQIRWYDSRNQLEKKLGWGRTIVADRLSSKYGQLALWTGSMEETPGAALRLGDGQRLPRYYPARGWLTQYIIVYRHSAGGRTAPGPTAASRLSWIRAPDGRHAKADALSSPGLQPALSRSTLRAPVVHVVPFLESFPNILSKCCKPYLATVKEIFENDFFRDHRGEESSRVFCQ